MDVLRIVAAFFKDPWHRITVLCAKKHNFFKDRPILYLLFSGMFFRSFSGSFTG